MQAAWTEPALEIDRSETLPYLVEHWYLKSRTTRYMVVRRFQEVLEHADLRPGHHVLDLGCGWAFGTHWAHTRGCRVTGIDLAHDQLRWARRALPDGASLGLTQTNAMALPFRDATFDRAVSVEMIEHVFRPDRPRVFAEIARVLKPGGVLALSTPNPASLIERAKLVVMKWPALRRRLPSACFPEAADDRDTYHPYRYHHPMSEAELASAIESAGFRVRGAKRFLWVLKTTPDALLGIGRALEGMAEAAPVVRRLGATTMIWADRS